LIKHVREPSNRLLYRDQFRNSYVEHERITYFTIDYANQLIREDDWEQALTVI